MIPSRGYRVHMLKLKQDEGNVMYFGVDIGIEVVCSWRVIDNLYPI